MAKLDEYKRKRKFDRTPEPSGEPEPSGKAAPAGRATRLPKPNLHLQTQTEHGNTFVVQKHRATRLHYDFRLAIDGALKSWAVPKGPSLNSSDKRLAVQTEDHPLAYGGFEGKIPEGNYGAGTVMVWDRGTCFLEGNGDALQQLAKGEIKFSLNGEKLRGSFALVKLKNSEKGNEWLMIKHKDASEDSAWNVDAHDGSVLTGRVIEEIAQELPPKRSVSLLYPYELDGARKSAMPSRFEPMLATIGERAFSDPNWLFEIKWDGVRAMAWISDGSANLRARSGGDITKRSDSRYVSERSSSWLKLKITKTLDAVVGGWTAARTAALPFGSLLLGLYQSKKLRFIGHVGSGFDGKRLEDLSAKLKEHATSVCPFEAVPETNEKPSWVTPALVARVKFSGWTQERSLRHPVFIALRADASAADCQWENEVAPATAAASPAIVRAPEVVGRVISAKAEIENELFKGKLETLTIELDGRRIRFSNLNKIYFPESGYTKRDLIAYYYRMADFLLPFLREGPLVLRRYPDGIKGQAFFQKDLREGIPEWFKTVPVDSEGGLGKEIHYATAGDRASLLFLTSLGCLDHNPWSSRYSD